VPSANDSAAKAVLHTHTPAREFARKRQPGPTGEIPERHDGNQTTVLVGPATSRAVRTARRRHESVPALRLETLTQSDVKARSLAGTHWGPSRPRRYFLHPPGVERAIWRVPCRLIGKEPQIKLHPVKRPLAARPSSPRSASDGVDPLGSPSLPLISSSSLPCSIAARLISPN